MQAIIPNIWCTRNAQEAGEFYAGIFDKASSYVEARYPETDLPEFQRSFAGAPQVVGLEIDGTRLTLINAGDEFRPNPALSFMLNFDPLMWDGSDTRARQYFDRVWERLSDGGEILMPLGKYGFSARYGWVQDRYGVSWQLILTDPNGEPRPFLMPVLLFGGEAQNRANEAVDFYLDVFDGSQLGRRELYGESHEAVTTQGPVTPESVLFSDFRLGEQWFVAMDSAVAQPVSFTAGVSLEVRCRDQGEIDRLWNALSAVPAAEQCGWLSDRFGVSWQIVPEHIDELMQRPGAYAKILQMKRIVIADF